MLRIGLTYSWLGRLSSAILAIIVWYIVAETGFVGFFKIKIEWLVGLMARRFYQRFPVNLLKKTVSTRYRKSYYRFGTFMQLPPMMAYLSNE